MNKKVHEFLVIFSFCYPFLLMSQEAQITEDENIDNAIEETVQFEEDTNQPNVTDTKDKFKNSVPNEKTFNIDKFSSKTSIEDPFSLRDPFKKPYKTKKNFQGDILKNKDGVFTNLPSIESFGISSIVITGILVGKERRAMANVDKETILIKEGMMLGDEGIEVKAIYPGGVVFVEKIVNVYGQEEYIETIVPVQDVNQIEQEEKNKKDKSNTKEVNNEK